MKPLEELTYRGQAARIRGIAAAALDRARVPADSLSLIFHGENTTFRARHRTGDHLVRVHRPGYQNRRTIASELELLTAVGESTDIIVPAAVGGLQTIGVPGVDPRNVVIFRWIPGRFSGRFTPHSMRRLGRVAARLHLLAEDFRPSDRFERQFATIEGLSGENMGGSIELWPDDSRDLADEVIERAADVFDRLGRERDVWGVIHADLHHGNRLVCAGGELAVIDFDDCSFGHYLYDIAVMLGFPRNRSPAEYPALFEAFVAGYRQLRPLSDEQLGCLDAFFAMRRIAIALWVLGRAADNPYFAGRAPAEIEGAVKLLRDSAARDW